MALSPDARPGTTASSAARAVAGAAGESAPEVAVVLNKGKARALPAVEGGEADDADEAEAGATLLRNDLDGEDEADADVADEGEESPVDEEEDEDEPEAGGEDDDEEEEQEPDEPDDGLLQDETLDQAGSDRSLEGGSDQDMEED